MLDVGVAFLADTKGQHAERGEGVTMAIWIDDPQTRRESWASRGVNAEYIFDFGSVGLDPRPHLDGIL